MGTTSPALKAPAPGRFRPGAGVPQPALRHQRSNFWQPPRRETTEEPPSTSLSSSVCDRCSYHGNPNATDSPRPHPSRSPMRPPGTCPSASRPRTETVCSPDSAQHALCQSPGPSMALRRPADRGHVGSELRRKTRQPPAFRRRRRGRQAEGSRQQPWPPCCPVLRLCLGPGCQSPCGQPNSRPPRGSAVANRTSSRGVSKAAFVRAFCVCKGRDALRPVCGPGNSKARPWPADAELPHRRGDRSA